MDDTLQIEFADEFPEALKASAGKCLQDAITFLEGIPRPTALPEIEYLTPNFSEMKFCFAEGAWPHGLFSVRSMKGWAVCSYKSSGDLLINSEPVVEVVNVDPNICTTASLVYMLDQYFHKYKRPEEHLLRQLQYLDSLAVNNKSIKSIVDDYEQHLAQQEQAQKDSDYKAELELKAYNRARKYAFDTACRTPLWWLQRWPDSPQSKKGEFLVTSGGIPIGTSDQWRNGELSPPAPAPNLAAQQVMSQERQPFSLSDAAAEEAASWQRLYDSALGRTTASSCEDHDL
jgi:hypothetical protein